MQLLNLCLNVLWGSTVIGAMVIQRESWTLRMDCSNSHSQSQPSVHTGLVQEISALRTESFLSGGSGTLGSSIQAFYCWDYLLLPSQFGPQSIATIDQLPWHRRSLMRPLPLVLILSWSWKRRRVEPSVQLQFLFFISLVIFSFYDNKKRTSLHSVNICWTLSKAMCQVAEGNGAWHWIRQRPRSWEAYILEDRAAVTDRRQTIKYIGCQTANTGVEKKKAG